MGLENIPIVLSADHGAPEVPEYMQSIGLDTGRFDFDHFKQTDPLSAVTRFQAAVLCTGMTN